MNTKESQSKTKIITIADDLTGANVNAALLASHGFTAATCIASSHWDVKQFEQFNAVCINTGSRQLPVEQAQEVTRQAIAKAFAQKPAVLAKRIDSTLRGHIGYEVEAALEVMPKTAMALLCPSFPASGRIAAGGHLIVDGLPLERTDAAKDPVNPIDTSKIIRIFRKQSTLSTALLPLDVVLKGVTAIETHLLALCADGIRVVVCDALTDDDITNIAEAAKVLEVPLLCADSGPLCNALALAKLGTEVAHLENRVLAVVGSVMDIVRHQLDALVVHMRTHLVSVHGQALTYEEGHPLREAELNRLEQALLAAPEDAQILGLCSARYKDEIIDIKSIAEEQGVSVSEISLRITTALAEVAARVFEHQHLRLGGLFTSGGEVAMAVSKRLDAQGFSVRSEVLSRAMYGRFIGGKFPHMPMVTKGGLVGDAMAIVRCVEFLLTKISSQSTEQQNVSTVQRHSA